MTEEIEISDETARIFERFRRLYGEKEEPISDDEYLCRLLMLHMERGLEDKVGVGVGRRLTQRVRK